MTKSKTNTAVDSRHIKLKTISTKHQQVIELLTREGGVTLETMSNKVGWLSHSTRAFMTSLKKKGYVIDSEKVAGVRHYRITKLPVA
ncbi:MAG: DUF3489 domain-containing protein [Pseudomonadota bacterium]|jgi:predicted ArsR family transcriptional regulator